MKNTPKICNNSAALVEEQTFPLASLNFWSHDLPKEGRKTDIFAAPVGARKKCKITDFADRKLHKQTAHFKSLSLDTQGICGPIEGVLHDLVDCFSLTEDTCEVPGAQVVALGCCNQKTSGATAKVE